MEIARYQYELVLDGARGVMLRPAGDERARELARLRRSPSILDRYAAATAARWLALERSTP